MSRPIKFRAWDKKGILVKRMQFYTFPFFSQWFCDRYLLEEWEIMQFTGLLDKNGKEIYEGDIVDGTLDVGMENGCTENFRAPVVWSGMGYWDIGVPASEVEIIGNIYENPELV